MNKFLSPNKAAKLLVIFSVLVFLWIMSATASPIKPHRLEKYGIKNLSCHADNISSWKGIDDGLTIKTLRSSLSLLNYSDLAYQGTPANPGEFEFWCKFDMPEMILYKALTLNITYKINQPTSFELGLHHAGMGPTWAPISIDSTQTNKLITSTWILDEADLPKINWLSGPYEEITFRISKFDPNKELILSIYEVYLE